jgi:exodeoxyribonuclease VII large subunit
MSSYTIQSYHQLLNRTLTNAHRPIQLTCEVVKANTSQQRVFFEVASQGHRLQCGLSQAPKIPLKPGEPLVLDVSRAPKIWRNGNVGLWLPAYALHRTQKSEDTNAKERQCQDNMAALKAQALLEKQKEGHALRVARRIFLVTAQKSDAYADFCDELKKASHVAWDICTLNTVMQGQECVASAQAAFQYIQSHARDGDVVVLTRGGGSPEDLAPFNTLTLAQCVALCPLPVLTAIGHHRDQSLCDQVAYHSCKTPTAAATYLIHHTQLLCNPLERQVEYIHRLVTRNREKRQQRVVHYKHRLARLRAARPLARKLRIAECLHHIRNLIHAAQKARSLTCRVITEDGKALITPETLEQHIGKYVRITLPCGWLVVGRLEKKHVDPDTA